MKKYLLMSVHVQLLEQERQEHDQAKINEGKQVKATDDECKHETKIS